MSAFDDLYLAAVDRLCDLGRGDHGHTDCWIISGLLDEVDRLNAETEDQKRRLEEVMTYPWV